MKLLLLFIDVLCYPRMKSASLTKRLIRGHGTDSSSLRRLRNVLNVVSVAPKEMFYLSF